MVLNSFFFVLFFFTLNICNSPSDYTVPWARPLGLPVQMLSWWHQSWWEPRKYHCGSRHTRLEIHQNQNVYMSPVKLTTLRRSYSEWKNLKSEKSWKITNSGRDQSGFTGKLGENVSDTAAAITGDVQWGTPHCFVCTSRQILWYLDLWCCTSLTLSTSQAVRHQKLCYLNVPGAAAKISTMSSAICPEVLRPPKLLFLYREGTCLLSFLTESRVQTATAEKKKRLKQGIWNCKSSSEQGLTTALTQSSALSSWLAFRQLCKIYSPRKI